MLVALKVVRVAPHFAHHVLQTRVGGEQAVRTLGGEGEGEGGGGRGGGEREREGKGRREAEEEGGREAFC